MSDPISIRANNICRYYGDQPVLQNISFAALKGEVTGILGPNGAGKSTLMQIIAGVMATSLGKITIGEFDLYKDPVQARSILGYLPDRPPLYTDCDVDTYLFYCSKIHGVPPARQQASVDGVKEKCGLQNAGGTQIQHLSKGFQQRVGLAQAIIHSPGVIILDEPSSGLDPRQMVEMRNLITGLKTDHCILFSTHVLSEAYQLCDKVLIISNGEIVLDQSITKFESEKDLENAYVEITGIIPSRPHSGNHDNSNHKV